MWFNNGSRMKLTDTLYLNYCSVSEAHVHLVHNEWKPYFRDQYKLYYLDINSSFSLNANDPTPLVATILMIYC